MKMRSFVRASLLLLALLPAARPAHADPIILSGLIAKTGTQEASVEWSATENFTFRGLITTWAGFANSLCSPVCSAGQMVNLGGWAEGSDVRGTVTIENQTFFAASGNVGTGHLNLFFTGSAVLPVTLEPAAQVSAPFSLTGLLTFPMTSLLDPPRRAGFTGSGTTTLFLEPSVPFPGSWRLTRVEYRFESDVEPIPEPSTLVLCGAGLAALARRRIARRRLANDARPTPD